MKLLRIVARLLPSLIMTAQNRVRGRIATGPNSGRRVKAMGGGGEPEEAEPAGNRRCADVDGFSVHANVSVRAHDRKGIERLCRYMARPPLAVERLDRVSDNRLSYRRDARAD